jgi:hypothetical protein
MTAMIRRDAGNDFLLITQHDHAMLSGQLARHVGNADFAAPSPFNETVEAVSQHDCGWPLHDDQPTLNKAGLPLHVFEVPVPIAVRVWSASVAHASELGPYQGLLVSLHVMGLSAYAQTHLAPGNWSRQEFFEINKFQHRQVEVQERLRGQLGLSNEVPLNLGLAEPGTSAADDQLLFNFRLLTAMDRVSLALCCGTPMFPTMDDVRPGAGQPPRRITAGMPDESTMTLSPWPFDVDRVELDVPARRVRKGPFESLEAFEDTYWRTAAEVLRLVVRRSFQTS